MTGSKSKLDYALEYAARGWRVMPLHNIAGGVCTCHKPGCKTPAKHPRIIDPLKQATTEEAKIRRWWEMWPDSNVAIVTGAESGCVVLDVDPKSGGTDSMQSLLKQYGDFPERVLAETGGKGYHLFFKHPGGHWANTQGTPTQPSCLGHGLDFRGDGGYVVAVGSEHVSGGTYRWKIQPNGHLPEAPAWLLDKLKNRGQSSNFQVTDGESQILEGNRHNTLRAWACQMRSKGMSKAGIYAAIVAENATRFSEPKEDDEVQRIVDWVCKFAPGDVPNWKDISPLDEPAQAEAEAEPDYTGLVSVRDIQAEMDLLYTEGAKPGLNPGWASLNELYTIHPGDNTIIIAAPSAGKTTFGLNIVANMAISYGWRIAVCSTENRISMMMADVASMVVGASYYGNFQSRMSQEEKLYADSFLYDHFRWITPSPNEPFTLPYVLSRAKAMDADGVIVDPFGALTLPNGKGNSNDSTIIRQLLHGVVQPFMKKENMHLWLMHHTTKLPLDSNGDMQMPTPYNATDSAGFFNAADFLITMRRPKSRGGSISEFEVQKVRDRFSGQTGRCEFVFDPRTGRYKESFEGDYPATDPNRNRVSYDDQGNVRF